MVKGSGEAQLLRFLLPFQIFPHMRERQTIALLQDAAVLKREVLL